MKNICLCVFVCVCEACEMCYLFMIQSFSGRTIRNFTEKTESGEPDEMLYCITIQTCFGANGDEILLHVYIYIYIYIYRERERERER